MQSLGSKKVTEGLEMAYVGIDRHIAKICLYEDSFFYRFPNVVGIALGYKIINKRVTKIKCIHIYVTKKIKCLHPHLRVPPYYKGVYTDVIQTGPFYAGAGPLKNGGNGFTNRERPFKPGYSIGPITGRSTGTGCCIVEGNSRGRDRFYLLSSCLTIANGGTESIFTRIIQPGVADGGTTDDVIGYIEHFEKIQYIIPGVKTCNYADVGIVSLTKKLNDPVDDLNVITPEIAFMTKPLGTALVNLGGAIQKSGQASGYTTGTITSMIASVVVMYPNGKAACFKNQVVCTNIGDYGDSGSAVLDMENNIVGMFLGYSMEGACLFTPIEVAIGIVECKIFI